MIEHLHGLPVQREHTSFRLTDDELSATTNNEYFTMINHITKTSFLLKDSRLSRVKTFLDERMKNYIENVVELDDKFVMTQSWSTLTKRGESHHIHNHSNTIFSLVFYVSSEGEKSGNFVFDFQPSRLRERWDFSFKVKRYNTFNSSTWEYVVNTGDLIIFPAWMHHYTKENITNKDRIVIGANYFIHGVTGSTKGVDKIGIKVGDLEDD
tara:strand:+ start:197 stop:826 length:630 start_codon:yes stop_codon:yes gene_type:complete